MASRFDTQEKPYAVSGVVHEEIGFELYTVSAEAEWRLPRGLEDKFTFRYTRQFKDGSTKTHGYLTALGPYEGPVEICCYKRGERSRLATVELEATFELPRPGQKPSKKSAFFAAPQ